METYPCRHKIPINLNSGTPAWQPLRVCRQDTHALLNHSL